MDKQHSINVVITFALAKEPFHQQFPPETSVGDIRKAAMAQFSVTEDAQSRYYLTNKGERLQDNTTLDHIADHAHGLKFTLVKELIQGNGQRIAFEPHRG